MCVDRRQSTTRAECAVNVLLRSEDAAALLAPQAMSTGSFEDVQQLSDESSRVAG